MFPDEGNLELAWPRRWLMALKRFIVSLLRRLWDAVQFWINRIDKGEWKILLLLLVSSSLIMCAMEARRTFGFWYFEDYPLDFRSLIVPPLFSLLTFPLILILRSRLSRALLLLSFPIVSTLIIQFFFSTPGVISLVWYPILGGALCLTFFLHRLGGMKDELDQLQNIEDLDRRRHVVDLIADRSKFYIDRWVVSALSLGATVGVMMTILWGDPYGAFIGTRGQKLADSGYMIIAFFYVVSLTGAGVALPAHNIYSKCSRTMLNVMDRGK